MTLEQHSILAKKAADFPALMVTLTKAWTVIFALSGAPVLAVEPIPGKFAAACERILTNRGWITPIVRAQIMPIDAQIRQLGYVTGEPSAPLLAITLAQGNNPVRFFRTGRTVEDMIRIDQDFPREFFLPENFVGKRILDLACGEGRAVEEIRRAGFNIVGLDIFLTPYMLSKPYYIRASADKTCLPDRSFDIIYSDQGPFTYFANDPVMLEKLMREQHRLLDKGGVLRISSVTKGDFRLHGSRPEIDLRNTIYTNLPPGMRIKSKPDKWWFIANDPGEGFHQARYWLELERTD